MSKPKNLISFHASIIDLCTSTKYLKTLNQAHARTITVGISHQDYIRAKLISSYAKCGQMMEATFIFSLTNCQSTYFGYLIPFYASIIDLCTSTRHLKPVKQVHAQTINVGISHHGYIRAKLISSYSKCGQMMEATFIFSLTNCQSTYLYNCLIRGFASLSLFNHSLSLFRQMLVACKPLDRHTFPSLIKSCAGQSGLRLGQQIHAAVLTNGFALDPPNSNSLVTMYAQNGDLISARKVFDTMMGKNLISWSAMMSGYEMHGDVEEVFFLFNTMVNMGILPDKMTFTIVLVACGHAGLIDTGMEYFETMEKKYDIRPGLEHYTCIVNMSGKVGRLDEAENLILEMEIEPDEALWGVLLGACKIHKKEEVAERVAKKIHAKRKCRILFSV